MIGRSATSKLLAASALLGMSVGSVPAASFNPDAEAPYHRDERRRAKQNRVTTEHDLSRLAIARAKRMRKRLTRQANTVYHVGDIIDYELRERGWSRDELATRMMPPYLLDPLDHEFWGVTRLVVDLLLDVREPDMMLGDAAIDLARAFGGDPGVWWEINRRWRESKGVRDAIG